MTARLLVLKGASPVEPRYGLLLGNTGAALLCQVLTGKLRGGVVLPIRVVEGTCLKHGPVRKRE